MSRRMDLSVPCWRPAVARANTFFESYPVVSLAGVPPLRRVIELANLNAIHFRETKSLRHQAEVSWVRLFLVRAVPEPVLSLACPLRYRQLQEGDTWSTILPGTAAAGIILAQQATELQLIAQQWAATAQQIEALVAPHPLCPVLTSMPGLGVRTAAQVIVETAGKAFTSAAALAAYAGLIPVTWRSGSSVNRDHAAKRGNPALNHALFQSAFTSLRHPPSRAYYDRKRREGKSHTHAVLALARRRTDVLFVMMRDGTMYRDPAPPPLTTT